MNKFHDKFRAILNEAPELPIDPELERDAANSTLSDDLSMDDFESDLDIDPSAGNEFEDAMARQNQQMISQIDGWSSQIDQFLEFLNGDSPESLQSKLSGAVDGTVVGHLKAQQQKIGRIASDLAALQQSFNTAKKTS
jgi:hypothetical protein